MTTEPIDHAAEALNYLGAAVVDTHGDDDRKVAIAAVHAQLASVAAQDRANELKRIEILAALSYGGGYSDPEVNSTFAEVAAWNALHDSAIKGHPLAPSIAASLGLGGESDGE